MKNIKHELWLCFVLLLLGIPASLSGNTSPLTDSIKQALQTAPDTSKVKILSDLCWNYRTISLDSALNYGHKALAWAQKIDFTKGAAQAHNDIGIIYYYKSDYAYAIDHYKKSLALREQMKDTMGIAAIYNKIGIVHQSKGDYKEALEIQLKTLKIYEQLEDDIGTSYSINNIAVILHDMGNYNQALDYHYQSLTIKRKIGDKMGASGTLTNIGNIYQKQGEYEKAVEIYREAIELIRQVGDKEYLAATLNNLGSVIIQLNRPMEALEYLKEGLAIREGLTDKKGISSSLINIGSAYLETGNYSQAESMLRKSIAIAEEINAKPELMQSYFTLSTLLDSLGRYEEALRSYSIHTTYKDSIINEKNNEHIAELQTKYETDKQEKQIALLRKDSEIQALELEQSQSRGKLQLMLSAGSLALFLIGGSFFYNRNRLRQKARMEQEVNRLQKLRFKAVLEAQEKERKRIAQELHDGLGQLLSTARLNVSSLEDLTAADLEDKQCLDNSLSLIDEACQEVRHISHNMMPGALIKLGLLPAINELVKKINSSNQMKVHFKTIALDERLEEALEITIYRIIQEVTNNILKHAHAKNIYIDLTKDEWGVTLNIKDDGQGMDINTVHSSSGIGWKNIFSRVTMFNGDINIQSAPGRGTAINIQLAA